MFAKKVGIDLGTANVLVYIKGRGVVIHEPSVVALAKRDNRILAVGSDAWNMFGRTPSNISVIRPMRDGVVADYLVTEAMLHHFIGRVHKGLRLFKPQVMVCIPIGATSVERRAVREAAETAGARKPVHLIPEPLAAAIGAGMPIHLPRGNMVVDIGGGRTEAAVVSMYGIVSSESIRVAGDKINDAIIAHMKRRHNLIIGDRTADEVKIAVGSALPLEQGLSTEVQGRHQLTGLPKTIPVTSEEITNAIAEPLAAIVATAKAVLTKTPPELASDVIDQGIVLTGGSSLLRNLDQLLTQETGVPCQVASEAMKCVATGAGLALEHLDEISWSLPSEEEFLVASY